MKNIIRISTLIVAVSLVFTACHKEKLNSAEPEAKLKAIQSKMLLSETSEDMEAYQRLLLVNSNRLKNVISLMSNHDCMTSIQVPKDYATIQEAVDAACPGADIIVTEGTYDEVVFIITPGLHVKAKGNVMLNGGFLLSPDADDVKIQKFTIIPGVPFGIRTYAIAGDDLSGVEIFQNTIPNNPDMVVRGIYLQNSSNCTVRDNTISEVSWGIIFAGVCQKNSILNNKVLNINGASGIHLQGDCDYNTLGGNIVLDKIGSNGGITLASIDDISACDYNVLRNNISSNSAFLGFWEWGPGSNNTIGPNNKFNGNGFAGIGIGFSFNSIIYGLGTGNHIFNNEILNSGICDILDEGGTTNNTYKNNKYGCFSDTP